MVLEQLLRVAGEAVGRVYVLARARGRLGAAERVGRVLGGGLFTTVRERHGEAMRKVRGGGGGRGGGQEEEGEGEWLR